jgi:hypothetical protein
MVSSMLRQTIYLAWMSPLLKSLADTDLYTAKVVAWAAVYNKAHIEADRTNRCFVT